ncbi:pectate lyase [Sphingomonas sp. ST-64]|uniref:Pectate lyase n=1 Tax=Sphingomonas plantiphila TaxID=3163295 RepID=A0ABW8YNX8_9SPHN
MRLNVAVSVALSISLALSPISLWAQQSDRQPDCAVPAFPTAEGYGRCTVGGRGGVVLEVTNLLDSGPGSLRAAVDAKGPRTIVFRVSGTIDLQSPLQIKHPYITLAGQTAPGDGITVKRYPLIIGADEVIVRHMRFRLGAESGAGYDAVTSRYNKSLILDHISASWSVDETLSVYQNEYVTVQWSIIAESLYKSNHEKGNHGYGAMFGSNYSTYHHNLIAHHSSRSPRIVSGAGFTDIRNNVIYNWGYQSAYGGENRQPGGNRAVDFSTINYVGNYLKPGPATVPGAVSHRIVNPLSRDGATDYGKWYVADNLVEGNEAVSADNWNGGVQTEGGPAPDAGLRLHEPWPAMPINQQTPREAYELVLANAGAAKPRRDAVDMRILSEVRSGTASFGGHSYKSEHRVRDASVPVGIIDSPADVGGWPVLRSGQAASDSDHDGMPDDWERSRGLDPRNPADRNLLGEKGYTMLEIYLHSIS